MGKRVGGVHTFDGVNGNWEICVTLGFVVGGAFGRIAAEAAIEHAEVHPERNARFYGC